MAVNDKKTVTTESKPASSEDLQAMTVYRPQQLAPLPDNRPIADNSTEDIDEMLGYLD